MTWPGVMLSSWPGSKTICQKSARALVGLRKLIHKETLVTAGADPLLGGAGLCCAGAKVPLFRGVARVNP